MNHHPNMRGRVRALGIVKVIGCFMMISNINVIVACGSRRTVEQAEPTPPSSRGVVSSQKTDWQGVPSIGAIQSSGVKTPGQSSQTPVISIFFLRYPKTTSDGEDFTEESEIKAWFGPEPVVR